MKDEYINGIKICNSTKSENDESISANKDVMDKIKVTSNKSDSNNVSSFDEKIYLLKDKLSKMEKFNDNIFLWTIISLIGSVICLFAVIIVACAKLKLIGMWITFLVIFAILFLVFIGIYFNFKINIRAKEVEILNAEKNNFLAKPGIIEVEQINGIGGSNFQKNVVYKNDDKYYLCYSTEEYRENYDFMKKISSTLIDPSKYKKFTLDEINYIFPTTYIYDEFNFRLVIGNDCFDIISFKNKNNTWYTTQFGKIVYDYCKEKDKIQLILHLYRVRSNRGIELKKKKIGEHVVYMGTHMDYKIAKEKLDSQTLRNLKVYTDYEEYEEEVPSISFYIFAKDEGDAEDRACKLSTKCENYGVQSIYLDDSPYEDLIGSVVNME